MTQEKEHSDEGRGWLGAIAFALKWDRLDRVQADREVWRWEIHAGAGALDGSEETGDSAGLCGGAHNKEAGVELWPQVEASSAHLVLAFPQANRHGAGEHLLKNWWHHHTTYCPVGRVLQRTPYAHLRQLPHRGRYTLFSAARDTWPAPEGHHPGPGSGAPHTVRSLLAPKPRTWAPHQRPLCQRPRPPPHH